MLSKKPFIYIKIAGYILLPVILLVLPATYFDEGQAVCVSRVVFDIECYGCGLTRAIMHLVHLDIATAWSYNKLSVLVFPLLCIVWAKAFWEDVQKADLLPQKQ
jgi:hypothetical protein